MNKTRTTGKLRLERETLRTLCSDTLEGVGGGMAVPWTFTRTFTENGGQVGGGTLGDFTKPQPAPPPGPTVGDRITDRFTRPRLGSCFCPPGGGQ